MSFILGVRCRKEWHPELSRRKSIRMSLRFSTRWAAMARENMVFYLILIPMRGPTNLVPLEDTGKWQMTQGGTPLQVMILKNKEAEFAFNASSPLQKCRIKQVRIDRIDNSELFEIAAIDSGFFQIGVPQQVVIKHSPKNAIILIAPPSQIPLQTIQYLTKL
jgi:hypothetical protein